MVRVLFTLGLLAASPPSLRNGVEAASCVRDVSAVHDPPPTPPNGYCDEDRNWWDSLGGAAMLYKTYADQEPASAKANFQKDLKIFPLGPIGDCTAESIDGQPASPARPALFTLDMFQDGARNFNANDLPVINTYYDDDGRPTDVYQPMETWNGGVDIFGVGGQCKPSLYDTFEKVDPDDNTHTWTRSGGFFFYYAPNSVAPYSPGPTVKVCKGRQSVLRFCNTAKGATPISVHLHGAGSLSIYDGWADDVTNPSYCKEYVYPNNRATTLWYHDHSVGITADNAYSGLVSMYIVKECNSDLELNYLPSEEHSIPFVITDAVLQSKGPYKYDLLYQKNGDAGHKNEVHGDIIMINGRAWPKLTVSRRVYRLRMLNASISRSYFIKILAVSRNGQQEWLPFWLHQTDGGNVKSMIKLYSIAIAVAERNSILVSFDPSSADWPSLDGVDDQWEHVYAVNDLGDGGYTQFCKTHLLSRFDIDYSGSRGIDDQPRGIDVELAASFPNVLNKQGRPFEALRNFFNEASITDALLKVKNGKPDREFDFGRHNGKWAINNCLWLDRECRIIANPGLNGIEYWKFKGHGGWWHPVHIHLIDFLVIYRHGSETDVWEDYNPLCADPKSDVRFNSLGSAVNGVRAWEVNAPKDVVHLGQSQDVHVLALWGPHEGDFMFHCHNLVHEDSDMMVSFGVGRKQTAQQYLDVTGQLMNTEDSGNELFTSDLGTSVTKVENWIAGSTIKGTNGSPYSPQSDGIPIPEWRSGTGSSPTLKAATYHFTENIGRFDHDWMCTLVCNKMYEVFYPNRDNVLEDNQFNLRGATNIQNNIWAVEYPKTESANVMPFAPLGGKTVNGENVLYEEVTCDCFL